MPRGLVAALLFLVAGSPSAALAAGGAYAVDDSDTNPPGDCKIDAWGSAADNRDRALVVSPACTLTALPTVEWAAEFRRARDAGAMSTEVAAKAKAGLLPLDQHGVGVALAGRIGYAAQQHRIGNVSMNVPVSFKPVDDVKLNVNAGLLRDELREQNFRTWGAGAEWALSSVTLIGEVFGQTQSRPRWQAGPRFGVLDGAMDIDVIAGRNITGAPANWLTLGSTLRF